MPPPAPFGRTRDRENCGKNGDPYQILILRLKRKQEFQRQRDPFACAAREDVRRRLRPLAAKSAARAAREKCRTETAVAGWCETTLLNLNTFGHAESAIPGKARKCVQCTKRAPVCCYSAANGRSIKGANFTQKSGKRVN